MGIIWWALKKAAQKVRGPQPNYADPGCIMCRGRGEVHGAGNYFEPCRCVVRNQGTIIANAGRDAGQSPDFHRDPNDPAYQEFLKDYRENVFTTTPYDNDRLYEDILNTPFDVPPDDPQPQVVIHNHFHGSFHRVDLGEPPTEDEQEKKDD